MQNFFVLGICFSIGYFLKITNRVPDNAHKTVNAFILHISLPAQVLVYAGNLSFKSDLLIPAGMAWIVFFLCFIILFSMKNFFNLNNKIVGCLLLTAGLGNTSFLGLPLIEAFFGKEFTAIGILCDQPGTFLVLSLVGIPIALQASSISTNYLSLFKRIITFPPFIAFVISLSVANIELPIVLIKVLSRLGDTLAPLALFSVGFHFSIGSFKHYKKELLLGLFLKMILAPLVIFIFYILILKNNSMYVKISVFEAAMPPMITGGIVAADNDLAPELASMMIAMGVLLSIITLPVWKYLLTI